MRRSILLLCILIMISLSNAKAQERVINMEATHFQIPHKKDSIDFIVLNKELNAKKPLLIWCQGSLPYPLYIAFKTGELYLLGGGIGNIDYKAIQKDFHLVVISMPKTPLIIHEAQLNAAYWLEKENENEPIDEFLKNDKLENYVSRANSVIAYLKKQKWVDKKQILVD